MVEDEAGEIVGGVGIGDLPGAPGVCELQKMYLLPEARGKGLAQELMGMALEFAQIYYDACYLETISNMIAAHRLYERYGFELIPEKLGDTPHNACDVFYLKTF